MKYFLIQLGTGEWINPYGILTVIDGKTNVEIQYDGVVKVVRLMTGETPVQARDRIANQIVTFLSWPQGIKWGS